MEKVKAELKIRYVKLFKQLTKGCGKEFCPNEYCASCPYFQKVGNPKEAIELTSNLVTNKSIELCIENPIPPHSFNMAEVRSLKEVLEKKEFEIALNNVEAIFSNKLSLGISFRKHEKIGESFLVQDPDFDFEALELFIELCRKHEVLDTKMKGALSTLIQISWKETLETGTWIETCLGIRLFLLTLSIPSIHTSLSNTTLNHILYKALGLPPEIASTFISWITSMPEVLFKQLTRYLNAYLTDLLAEARKDDASLKKVCNVMDMIYASNKKKRRINYKEFYNDKINGDKGFRKNELKKWFMNRLHNNSNHFTLCDYAWMLNPESKSLMLMLESDLLMEEEVKSNGPQDLLSMIVRGPTSPYCVIEVRREFLIEDTLNILSKPLNFKKELKVKFRGEQGVDAGGVKKEFFQLIIRQIFDPAYSMFNYNEETRTFWFNSDTLEARIKFELIGFILGLALYNTVILDVHFPKIVYKKLLGHEATFDDLEDFSPAIAQSLEFMLNYEGDDLEEMLCCTFSVDLESYGKKTTVELKPGGKDEVVNQKNKHEYVKLYMDWLFNSSIHSLFEAFKKGFYKLYSGEFTSNCEPEELQLLICGSPNLDFMELEKVTRYENGYSKDSVIIKNFWSIIHEFDLELKKKFLFFSTGSDRAPVGGLGTMQFIIGKHGEDGEQLPSAHTCFNYLLLPPYTTRDKLREKLLIAINNSEGFGLIQDLMTYYSYHYNLILIQNNLLL